MTAQLFSTKKGKGSENYRPQNILRCRLHTFTIFSFCFSASYRGHSDSDLYSLQGPATFLLFYVFKRLLISNANAPSSGVSVKIRLKSVGLCTKKSERSKRRDWSGIKSISRARTLSFARFLHKNKKTELHLEKRTMALKIRVAVTVLRWLFLRGYSVQ